MALYFECRINRNTLLLKTVVFWRFCPLGRDINENKGAINIDNAHETRVTSIEIKVFCHFKITFDHVYSRKKDVKMRYNALKMSYVNQPIGPFY